MPLRPIFHHHHHHHPQSQQNLASELLFLFLKAIIIILLLTFFFIFLAIKIFTVILLFLLRAIIHCLHLQNELASLHRNMLPHFQFIGETETDDIQCVVCLESFRNGQWCRKLVACGHVFHRRCVDMWLVNVATCPTCRTPVQLNVGDHGSFVGVGNEEEIQLWIRTINDITVFMACKLQFLTFDDMRSCCRSICIISCMNCSTNFLLFVSSF